VGFFVKQKHKKKAEEKRKGKKQRTTTIYGQGFIPHPPPKDKNLLLTPKKQILFQFLKLAITFNDHNLQKIAISSVV